jgi:type II secretory pathway pseudopilin PulG
VELMVALVISGIVMATVFQILNGQTQAVANQGAREQSQQNVRGALEIMAGELRTAIPQGIIEATAQKITFMQPRAWGIVCGTNGPNSVDAVFPGTQALGAFTASAAAGVAINVAAAGHDWQPRKETNNARATVTAVQPLGAGEQGACAGMAPANVGAMGDVESVRITANWAIDGLVGNLALPQRREVVLYSITSYDVAEVNGRWWLRRSNGVTANGEPDQQPLAGPLQGQSGFGLTYYAADPATAVAAPGTTASELNALRMVRVRVATESEQAVNGRRQQDEGTIGVMLRNAP